MNSPVDRILFLQRTIGNQAVTRLIKSGALQTKLRIGQPGDKYEQEADRVAEQVMATSAHPATSSAPPRIQRLAGPSAGQAEAAPARVDQALTSPGKPLEPALRQDMEQRFGHDFSKVRVHSGAAAEQSAQTVNAHAYTVGHDIVFTAGRYAPGTHEGQRLLAHELTHVVQQTTSGAMLQRQPEIGLYEIGLYPGREDIDYCLLYPSEPSCSVLRHRGRWTDIDSPTVLGMWAKEWAINKLWSGSNLRFVQEHPESVSGVVEWVFPKLRAALYSPREFSGSAKARIDADEALQMRWGLPGVEGIRDQVLEEFLRRYTKQLEQALAHTPEGTELVTRPEEIRRVRYEPYDGIWWHRMQFIHKGLICPPREILDIKACPKGSEDRCPKGGEPLRDIWFILKRDPNWIYFSSDQRVDPFDWILHHVSGEVAESTQFAAELFPYLLKLGGFSLGLSSRLAVILASEILSALGEQGVRAARGEKMQSALEVVKGIGFGVVTAHFLEHLFNRSPGRALEQNLEEATETAAARARVEVARTDASLVERELRAGRARAVEDPDLIADGYRIEVDVISEGQAVTWRQKTDGGWCRFTSPAWCGHALGPEVDRAIEAARQVSRPSATGKPTEGYVEQYLGPRHKSQRRFLEGKKTVATKYGMSITDFYKGGKGVTATEVKNIHIEQEISSGFRDLQDQVGKYLTNLPRPAETRYWLFLDVRGQRLTRSLEDIAAIVAERTGQVFDDINFVTEIGVINFKAVRLGRAR